MSIRKRKTEKGETTEYHYEFMQSGKRHYGVCEGCTTVKAALAYEKSIRETAKKLVEQKSVTALVENFKNELTGGGTITLAEAFDLYSSKPRRKMPSGGQKAINLSQWNDFCSFMSETYPEIEQLGKVTKRHAEAYIKHLRENGRYVRAIQYTRKYKKNAVNHSYEAQSNLSGRTINAYHKTVKSVFSKLKEDAGILYNPFNFDMLDNNSETRDAFTIEELNLIGENLTDFVKPLFIIGTCTGLSEGDICNLKWKEIDGTWIKRRRRKTKAILEIPILEALAIFLSEQKEKAGNDIFVLPVHAAMYNKNPSGISHRVKIFLEGLGISTTRIIEGRSRVVSVKDLHSLRHTFAYIAGYNKIPLPEVQSVLGHMSPEMTMHYQAHSSRESKEKHFAKMPNFLNIPNTVKQIPESIESERLELKKLTDILPIEKIKEILNAIKDFRP